MKTGLDLAFAAVNEAGGVQCTSWAGSSRSTTGTARGAPGLVMKDLADTRTSSASRQLCTPNGQWRCRFTAGEALLFLRLGPFTTGAGLPPPGDPPYGNSLSTFLLSSNGRIRPRRTVKYLVDVPPHLALRDRGLRAAGRLWATPCLQRRGRRSGGVKCNRIPAAVPTGAARWATA